MTTPIEAFQRALQEGIDDGLAEIALDVVDAAAPIIAREAIDIGDLLRSGEIRQEAKGRWSAVWVSDHAPFVELGTRPHWPPEAPIREWVLRNMRIETPVGPKGPQPGRVLVKPRTRRGSRSPRDAEVDRLVYLVRRKIAMKGTEPVRFATRAARKVQKTAGATLSRNIVQRLAALGGS